MSRLPALAIRNVGRNRRRSLITAATIVVGVTMVTMVRGVTEGMGEVLAADAVQGRMGALQVHRTGFVESIDAVPTKLNMPYTDEMRARLLKLPHVTAATGRIQFDGLVSNGVSQTMFVGRGQDMAHEAEVCPRLQAIVKTGEPLAGDDAAAALVGFELAESFGTTPGQTVSVQTSSPTGRANALDLKVKGLTSSNFPFENKRVVMMPLKTAQELLGLEGRVTEYALAVDDLKNLDEAAAAVRAELGPEYEVHAWKDLNIFLKQALDRMNYILGIIGLVLFAVVLTGIVNTMLMSVFERVREIGTHLAVGVRRRQVMTMFLLEAAVIGLGGALLGTVGGRVVVAVLHERGIPFELSGVSGSNVLRPSAPWLFSLAAVGVAVAGAVLAAAWPAWRASRLNPVDALRTN